MDSLDETVPQVVVGILDQSLYSVINLVSQKININPKKYINPWYTFKQFPQNFFLIPLKWYYLSLAIFGIKSSTISLQFRPIQNPGGGGRSNLTDEQFIEGHRENCESDIENYAI